MPFRRSLPNKLRHQNASASSDGLWLVFMASPNLDPRPALETAAVAGQRQPVNADSSAAKDGSALAPPPRYDLLAEGEAHPCLLAGAPLCESNEGGVA